MSRISSNVCGIIQKYWWLQFALFYLLINQAIRILLLDERQGQQSSFLTASLIMMRHGSHQKLFGQVIEDSYETVTRSVQESTPQDVIRVAAIGQQQVRAADTVWNDSFEVLCGWRWNYRCSALLTTFCEQTFTFKIYYKQIFSLMVLRKTYSSQLLICTARS